jgi:hypothetical protein
LNQMQSLSGPETQIMTGAASMIAQKRASRAPGVPLDKGGSPSARAIDN